MPHALKAVMNHGQLLQTRGVVIGAWDMLGHNDSGFRPLLGVSGGLPGSRKHLMGLQE